LRKDCRMRSCNRRRQRQQDRLRSRHQLHDARAPNGRGAELLQE
jgi:hypothetical protein